MKSQFSGKLIAVLCVLMIGYSMSTAFGRGGRGGGGGFSGGGGARIGGGAIARPSGGAVARPSGGVSGAARPSIGSSPSLNRPGVGAARPSVPTAPSTRPGAGTGIGSRPSTLPSTRPGAGAGIGTGVGSRPSNLPSIRPGAGTGIGSRPSTLPSTRPGAGAGIGSGLPGRPGTGLPGLGTGAPGSRLPNQGAGLQDRLTNRPQTLEDRRGSLNDRLTTGREDWQQHRSDMQSGRQDWRDSNREDWQNFAGSNQYHHGGWYNGCWNPGDRWNYMWDNYPVAAALGVTRWGINRIAYGFGYWGYSNPYYGGSYNTSSYSYNYSQPLVVYADSGSGVSSDPSAAPAASAAGSSPQPTDEGMAAFEESRMAFYGGDYEKALALLDTTLKTMPHDTVVHEFRGLVLFALKKYPESAAAIYAVLSAGPGWDWTTMSGLYPNVDVYTQQLRELENFAKSNPKSADASFLLGYHYLTMGHKDSAAKSFSLALEQLPGDKLLMQLAGMTPRTDQAAKTPPPMPPAPADVPPEKILTVEKMVGNWQASSADAKFELQLSADGTFVWTFSRGTTTESVKGVFALDQNNLAMEPDAGGTMLAEISFTETSKFLFKMIGGEEKDPGLLFVRKD